MVSDGAGGVERLVRSAVAGPWSARLEAQCGERERGGLRVTCLVLFLPGGGKFLLVVEFDPDSGCLGLVERIAERGR